VRHLSDQTTNNVSAGGKFQTIKEKAKVNPWSSMISFVTKKTK
jgi:outer membrane protein W